MRVTYATLQGEFLRKGTRLQLATSTHDGTVDLVWLVEAMEYARSNGQAKVLGYLEAVLDDAVFEMEMAARR